MFFSRKLEAFMAVVEQGSLCKAARILNRTAPPVAKSIKDFEAVLGKTLFKRKKSGMTLTKEGQELYNDLKNLYLQEKEITKRYVSNEFRNVVNIYYDWGKDHHLIKLYQTAGINKIPINVLKFDYDKVNEISDYDGNILILSSEKIVSERFILLKKSQKEAIGICCRKQLYEHAEKNLLKLLNQFPWLCDPVLYKSQFIRDIESKATLGTNRINIRWMENSGFCDGLIQNGDYIGLTDKLPETCQLTPDIIFLPLDELSMTNSCYFYKSKAHGSILNRFIDAIEKIN
ncbi:helix-turn-helix domain-containing protein [Arsenophonus nasoniae]|uniref:LysR family transcriptional regulator n=1 Tax=Arsenophonus nasoniae TaxID=638 RepID=A0AA95K556_9GAMM|nr:LysR family transcriptional regulator [Arsenophonus nasoniae]WGL99976.1 LysR family transcriptional regulator [Arsenophonus nasoniae]